MDEFDNSNPFALSSPCNQHLLASSWRYKGNGLYISPEKKTPHAKSLSEEPSLHRESDMTVESPNLGDFAMLHTLLCILGWESTGSRVIQFCNFLVITILIGIDAYFGIAGSSGIISTLHCLAFWGLCMYTHLYGASLSFSSTNVEKWQQILTAPAKVGGLSRRRIMSQLRSYISNWALLGLIALPSYIMLVLYVRFDTGNVHQSLRHSIFGVFTSLISVLPLFVASALFTLEAIVRKITTNGFIERMQMIGGKSLIRTIKQHIMLLKLNSGEMLGKPMHIFRDYLTFLVATTWLAMLVCEFGVHGTVHSIVTGTGLGITICLVSLIQIKLSNVYQISRPVQTALDLLELVTNLPQNSKLRKRVGQNNFANYILYLQIVKAFHDDSKIKQALENMLEKN
jgi:hypothetical protein